jgi:putative flippase GtrA
MLVNDKSTLRFLIVGLISFILDYGLLLILHDAFRINLIVAASVSFVSGLLINFLLNKHWTFNAPKGAKQSSKQAMQYGLLVCVNLVFTNVIIGFGASIHVGPAITKPISTGIIMVLNYTLYQRVIFRSAPPIEPFPG